MRDWKVCKFGGTSLGKYAPQIAESIVEPAFKKCNVVVVCSALSQGKKKTGTTNKLLDILDTVLESPESNSSAILALENYHQIFARESIKQSFILDELKCKISEEFTKLRHILNAAYTLQEVTTKTFDTVVSTGEKLSSQIFVALLKDLNIPATLVYLDKVVDCCESEDLSDSNFYKKLSNCFADKVLACSDTIPVVTGFFGQISGGLFEQIGRGYSDLCAALIAAGIKASELQIWKEVDGIFTADPSVVPTARLLAQVTPEEAAELTYYGSEVVHPFTMEQVMREGIPIRILNVLNPQTQGTLVFPHSTLVRKPDNDEVGTVFKMPTAVTIKHNLIVMNIRSSTKMPSYVFLNQVFKCIEKHKIVVDLISTSQVNVSMVLQGSTQGRVLQRLREDLEKFSIVNVLRDMAILSLIGKEMRRLIGVAGKMFHTLAASSVNMEMISQGANEINISCVIKEEDARTAMRAVHEKLLSQASLSRVNSGIPL